MSYVDDAFKKLKSKLEITKGEEALAIKHHTAIRALVDSALDLEGSFLTGSYKRETKTKKLKDVDIFCVIDGEGDDRAKRDLLPTTILAELEKILRQEYDTVRIGRRSCTAVVGSEVDDEAEEVMSFDVVPAFPRAAGGYEIPDTTTGTWVATNPEVHQRRATEKNAACGSKWIPLVKMLKGWNREAGKPVSPSFLIEVMALDIVEPPFTTYQHEFRHFIATAAEQISNSWPDPAGLGPDVNTSMSVSEKQAAAKALSAALATAEDAIFLENAGKYREAVEVWRKLFGWRMPRP